MDKSPISLTIKIEPRTAKRFLKWGAGIILFVGLLFLLPALGAVLTIIVIALLLATLLSPVVNGLENHGMDRLLAVVLVFAVIVLIAIVAFEFIVPRVSVELDQMTRGLKNQAPGEFLQGLQTKLGDKFPVIANQEVQAKLQSKMTEILNGLFQKSITFIMSLFSAVTSFIMITFITFFFLKDGRRMQKTVVSWVPNRYFEMSLNILHKTSTQLGRYLRGQLLVALVVGTLAIIALKLLNIRYYFFIGAIAGLANIIPYFGPIVGAIPAVAIALIDTGSFGAVAAIIVAFASIQLFENVFVSPYIVSRSVELHPLTIIVVILIGGQLLGMFGMLLAVPTASIIKVTALELYWGFKNYRIL